MTNYKPTTKNEGPATTPTAQLDLEALEVLARAATPGFRFYKGGEVFVLTIPGIEKYNIATASTPANEEQIAAFPPETCLALIARIRSLEGALKEIKADVCEHADDTVWVGHYETLVERIDRILETKGDAE